MSCSSTRERMLEAAPGELSGRGDTAVARHVRTCEACRAVAGTLLAETGALGGALGSVAPRLTADEAVAVAVGPLRAAGPAPSPGDIHAVVPANPPGRARRWLFRWAPVPLAAAAALAALLAVGRDTKGPDPAPGGTHPDAAEAGLGERFAIEVAPDERVAVFDTSDPTIKVVWYY